MDYDHNMNDYVTLKDETESSIRKGKLVKYKYYDDQQEQEAERGRACSHSP